MEKNLTCELDGTMVAHAIMHIFGATQLVYYRHASFLTDHNSFKFSKKEIKNLTTIFNFLIIFCCTNNKCVCVSLILKKNNSSLIYIKETRARS
jgi:hypothetical protein